MHAPHYPVVALSLVVLLALAGCSTPSSRIGEKPDVAASLSPAEKARLKQGKVAIGDTFDMVHIACGEPDRRSEKASADGSKTVWIYERDLQQYESTEYVGARRNNMSGGQIANQNEIGRVGSYDGNGRYIHISPRFDAKYRKETVADVLLTFENGRVALIEVLKR